MFDKKKYIREYYLKNKERIKEQTKQYRIKNKDKIKEYDKFRNKRDNEKRRLNKKKYYDKNKEIIIEKNKKYHKINKDKRNKYGKQYRIENKDKLKEYRIENREKINKYEKEYWKKRKKTDKQFYIRYVLGNFLRINFNNYIKNNKLTNSKRYNIEWKLIIKKLYEILPEDYIEWNKNNPKNKYTIDHIIPLSKFDLTNPEEIKKAFAIKNHQWLKFIDNVNKGDKLICDTL